MGYIQKKKNAVLRYFRYSKHNDIEKHYFNILRMYLPNRNFNLVFEGFETLESYYNNGLVNDVPIAVIVHEKRCQFEDKADEAFAAWEELQEQGAMNVDAWA